MCRDQVQLHIVRPEVPFLRRYLEKKYRNSDHSEQLYVRMRQKKHGEWQRCMKTMTCPVKSFERSIRLEKAIYKYRPLTIAQNTQRL